MGTTRRTLSQQQNLYGEKLKEPIANVLKLMPAYFSDTEFLIEFRKCYQNLWDDLRREHQYYLLENKSFNGKKPLLFPEAGAFVFYKAYHAIKRSREHEREILPYEERKQLRESLVNKCEEVLRKREEREKHNTDILQSVVPNYVSNMISSYFHNSKTNPADINIRYYILNEIAKFANDSLAGFFITVMSSEHNDFCREFAFKTLQKWDKTVHLPKKRKGKKTPNEHIEPKLPSTPNELMDAFCTLQLEKDKSYNVFLSHRYEEVKYSVIAIKDMINKKGIQCVCRLDDEQRRAATR